GAKMYELLNRPVYCRCGTEAVVKVLEDQWFINYGDVEWKAQARECLAKMRIVPSELRVEFENVIGWLKHKACARRQGMGTKLPWDRDWIIESLSDSVIYMAYYTIAKHIYAEKIPPNKLTDAVFKFVLLGEGEADAVAAESGIEPYTLKAMREEFIYFYPLDSRNSGRDLVPNHLTFFIFNHAAIFPKQLWPKQIVVTGSVLMEGKKMSKSLGNIIPLRDAINEYGADPFRLTILSTAELLQDADFSPSLAKAQGERLERFFTSALELAKHSEAHNTSPSGLDRWLLSRIQHYVASITEAMDNLRFREAIHNAIYLIDQDIQWYQRRLGPSLDDASWKILREVLETRLLLLAPFIPHLCEEVWEALGKEGFISTARWPETDSSKIDLKSLVSEEMVKSLYQDVQSILQATKIAPRKIVFYTAASWKWDVYLASLQLAAEGRLQLPVLMRTLMADQTLRSHAQRIFSFAEKICSDLLRAPREVIKDRLSVGRLDDYAVINGSREFFARELKAEVVVYVEDDPGIYDPKDRARLAEPYRPGIYVE
ncbi:MAG: class I tRNA ligase family protein, partial [Candidatus Bathyarchaeia archaeon]